jgi:ABC-type ATPase with predicted acetyltransferase domain
MIVSIDNKIEPSQSYASERTRGLYNVDVEDGARFRMDVDVPIDREEPWQVSVIVGPSGSGKTSIARRLATVQGGFIDANILQSGLWDDRPIIDVLTERAGNYAKATAALSAVGLASVPSWLRPHQVLSNGEQFRSDMASLLLWSTVEAGERHGGRDFLLDEFTSVLDRQVAKVGAAAFAKQWRRQPGRRVILITPHYDILDWVEPDWWIDTAEGLDEFAGDRGVVQAREGSFQEARHHGGYSGDRVATLEC